MCDSPCKIKHVYVIKNDYTKNLIVLFRRVFSFDQKQDGKTEVHNDSTKEYFNRVFDRITKSGFYWDERSEESQEFGKRKSSYTRKDQGMLLDKGVNSISQSVVGGKTGKISNQKFLSLLRIDKLNLQNMM